MLIDYVNGQTGVILRLKARQDNTGARPGQGFTGLSSTSSGLIISTIADAEASATAYSTSGGTIDAIATLGVYAAPTTGHCRIREVDPTNHPGLIELQLANARFAVLGSKELTITVTGVAGMADCDAKVPLRSVNPYDGQAFGLAALPAAGTLAVSPILAASQSFNNPGQTSAIPANAVQFAGQAISAAAPVSVPASIGTSTFAPGGTVNVGQIGGQSVTASGPIAVLASVGTATTSTAQSGDSFARLGAPATTSISSDIQTRSTYAGGPVASVTGSVGSVTAPVTLPSTVPSGYATSASQASLAATLGTPATTSIAGDIATRSTYSGGPVASVTGSVGSVASAVTLPSTVPAGYATSASQVALAATLGTPATTSIAGDIATRSTYSGGPVASVTGSVGSVTAPVSVGGYSTGQDPATLTWGATTRTLSAFGFAVNANPVSLTTAERSAIATAILTDTSSTDEAAIGSLGHLVTTAPPWYSSPTSAASISTAVVSAMASSPVGSVASAVTLPSTVPSGYATSASQAALAATLGTPATTSIAGDIATRSTYAGGPVASVTGSVGSVTAPVTLPSTVPSGYATSASQASLAATLGTPATTSIAGDIATRSTYSGGPVASVTAPVTLPSSVPTGYATSASQAALAATLGAPVTASISSDIQTRSTYAGGPVASVTGSVGSVTAPVAISATGLDAVKGWGSWSARQTIQAIAQVLFGVRSGVPPVGSPGTVTFTGPASAAYGSLSVDNSGNVTATNLTPPA